MTAPITLPIPLNWEAYEEELEDHNENIVLGYD